MKLIPALDLLDQKAVRLLNGSLSTQWQYDIDPIAWVKNWTAIGAERLHLVNLSSAFKGCLSEADLSFLKLIRSATDLPIEYGGGIRDEATAKAVLHLGFDIVLGSMLISDLKTCTALQKNYGEKIIAGIDAKDGLVATHGWTQNSNLSALDFIEKLREARFSHFIFTDIGRDGTLSSPNMAMLKAIKNLGALKLVASGGVANLDDLKMLKACGIDGAVVGKALLDGLIDPSQALEVCHA